MDIKKLEEYLQKDDLTSEQKGAIYFSLAMAYLQINNENDKRYLETLEDGLRAIKIIDKKLKTSK